MSMATRIASEKKIMGLVAGAGEAVDPGETFSILHRITGPEKNVTAFLSDDRGRIVAWGGSGNAYPPGLRSIGPRLVCVKWTCLNAILSIREPLIVEGRIIGAVTITEHSPLTTRSAFGISVPPGWRMSLGRTRSGFFELNPAGFPTNLWPIDRYIRDKHRLVLPPDIPPGEYAISVGIYKLRDNERLPVQWADTGARADNVVLNKTITIRR